MHASRQNPHVLLITDRPDDNNRRSLRFERPTQILRLERGDDPRRFFDRVEEAAARGSWLAGYIAYEAGYVFEPRLEPLLVQKRPDVPLIWFGVFDAPAEVDPADPAGSYLITRLRYDTDREAYMQSIDRVESFIVDGETYQVNYTFRGHFDFTGSTEALFSELRRRQRVSYAAMIEDGERTILSLSPELFFERTGDVIRVKPMKGTAARGADASEDDELAAWLAADPKNRAENVMIVDMVRNDLGRLAPPGGVRVPVLFEVERYETLHQMTSTIEATVPGESSWYDVMRALFPCASVTGAPKIRTMELIADLERAPRGVYTGAIGYIGPNRRACFNVAIRTIVVDAGGKGEFGIGSGVVYDSDALSEYGECLLKGKFLAGLETTFGLLETMLLDGGNIYLRARHLDRLQSSAGHFGFACPLERIEEALDAVVRKNPKGRLKLRLLLDREGRLSIETEKLGDSQPQTARVRWSGNRVDPSDGMFRHKTTHRPLYDLEREAAVGDGFDEVVFLNTRDEVCEGTISNVFVKSGDEMFTPPLSSGCLPGTLRGELLARGECSERVLWPEDLKGADQVYIGNSVRGLVPAIFEV
jgi:para-aminobenzoate synthetase/4-amino-4-deoxychorismate lyase